MLQQIFLCLGIELNWAINVANIVVLQKTAVKSILDTGCPKVVPLRT